VFTCFQIQAWKRCFRIQAIDHTIGADELTKHSFKTVVFIFPVIDLFTAQLSGDYFKAVCRACGFHLD
jgi:hypothetical protein